MKRNNNNYEFSIFRKSSHSDQTIDCSSSHPFHHKSAEYNSMIHSLVIMPLSADDYTHELNIIKQIAQNNGYHHCFVDNIFRKRLYNKAISQVYPEVTDIHKNFRTLTYLGNPVSKISKFLSDF
ncbi:hypothetical protein WA026_007366 [Henosepilachna vigintioctopunctata]|uniref:Helix-turn-helix domain-containing protein n=1 Tax=Henosepilachna vigintioctopunctata TaxID=420089 RepID=A0AAW1UN58_9CUCU